MTRPSYNLKKMIAVGGAVFSALALPMVVSHVTSLDTGFISTAQAAEGGSGGQGGSGQAQKGKPSSTGGAMGGSGGGSMGKKVFRAPVSTEDDDSDRPVWAGVKGGKAGGGGRPPGAGTKKGDLFGDMVVILRDINGVPITTTVLGEQVVQPIAFITDAATGLLVPLKDASGNLVLIPYDLATGELLTTVTIDDGDADTIANNTYSVVPAEVDLGRLSVGRAPTKVLEKSLADALAVLTSGTVSVDATGRLVVTSSTGVVTTIDSPLANLALYDVYMTTGSIPGVTLPDNFDPAALLAAASDKAGTVTVDTVIYMNSILGINNLAVDPDVYYSFLTYDYDRYTTWSTVVVEVLVQYTNPDGSVYYVPEDVNVYEAVFNSTDWVDPTPTTGSALDFATAADDYLQVIEFVHDNAVR